MQPNKALQAISGIGLLLATIPSCLGQPVSPDAKNKPEMSIQRIFGKKAQPKELGTYSTKGLATLVRYEAALQQAANSEFIPPYAELGWARKLTLSLASDKTSKNPCRSQVLKLREQLVRDSAESSVANIEQAIPRKESEVRRIAVGDCGW
ncbi:MAG TPA: hypothetical protein V6C81_24785 [Planktothrix sp.]|jgi:hypothetical protein